MPHKHKRKSDDDTSNFDLAPSTQAKPLAAYNKASIFSKDEETSSNKRRKPNASKPKKSQDDTPKAFARLMAWQTSGKKPNGLDNGTVTKKKQRKLKQQQSKSITDPSSTQPAPKTTTTTETTATKISSSKPKPSSNPIPTPAPAQAQATPKILPGETLSNFSLRVDQSLPLTTITRTTNPHLPPDILQSLKNQQKTTKHNKRLQKMQADWRLTEAKLQEREAEEAEELEDTKEEEDLLWAGVRSARNSRKGNKRRLLLGKDEDDPWKELEKKRREETKQKNLQDVVKAPPVLKKVKSKFKVRAEDYHALDGVDGSVGMEEVVVDVGNVPNAVGSLRRREELNATRRAVIEGYRKMNGRKRGVGERLSMSRAIAT